MVNGKGVEVGVGVGEGEEVWGLEIEHRVGLIDMGEGVFCMRP